MSATTRLRSKNVTLGLTLVAASAFTAGCATSDGSAICVDPQTETRVDDDSCDDSDEDYDGTQTSGFFWFYIPAGNSAPAVGSAYNPSTGYYKAPAGKSYTKGGVSKSGGSISKGGFGSSGGKGSS